MANLDDLERRARDLIERIGIGLEGFKREFFEAGYRGDVLYLIPTLNFPGDMRPSLFENLILQFYRGIEKRLREEQDPFEKAFLFLAAYSGFIPIEHPHIMLQKAQATEEVEFQTVAGLMYNSPDILRDQRERFGVDNNANQALAILNQAGAYVLAELGARDDQLDEQYRSRIDDKTLVQNFKRYIDRVIEIGRLPWVERPDVPVKIIEAAGDPIAILRVISQNADKFVRRYAALHGYEMGIK